MNAISAAELASIGVDVQVLMDASCDILRATTVDDGQGGSSESYEMVSTVPCLVVNASSPSSQVVAQNLVASVLKDVLMPLDTDVRRTDRLSITSSGITGTFVIIDIYNPASYEVVMRVLAKREEA